MKTFEEFLDELKNDEAFNNELTALVKEEKKNGAASVFEAAAKAAAKLGYDVTEEQLKAQAEAKAKISEQDLGDISGGGSVCVCGYGQKVDRGCGK